MTCLEEPFGSSQLFTLQNNQGAVVRLLSLGAALNGVAMPDKTGRIEEVALGLAKPASPTDPFAYLGSTVGRFSNRIIGGSFAIGSKRYQAALNDRGNSLHGGPQGFSFREFNARIIKTNSSIRVEFSRLSPDGEEGFPGNLETVICYQFNNRNELAISYKAKTDQDTLCNLTNHAYWNLEGRGSVLNHKLKINADFYLPTDAGNAPTGEILKTEASLFDFKEIKPIGKDINQLKQGYDHCFLLNRRQPRLAAAALIAPQSGRTLEIFTTESALQLYTANALAPVMGRNKICFGKHDAVCLETQGWPASPNYTHFKSAILKAGKVYRSSTIYKFGLLV